MRWLRGNSRWGRALGAWPAAALARAWPRLRLLYVGTETTPSLISFRQQQLKQRVQGFHEVKEKQASTYFGFCEKLHSGAFASVPIVAIF
jgi:hypothetical protein